jgi:hypothetical protein
MGIARIRSSSLVVLVTTTFALAPGAQARTVSLTPTVGDFETSYTLRGVGWQPSRAATVEYYTLDLAKKPVHKFKVRADGRGGLSFRLSQPSVFEEQGVTEKLCFLQSDTRAKKTIRRCARFYVQAPSANIEPSDVKRGDHLLLRVTGWRAGTNLTVDLVRPDGSILTSSVVTRILPSGYAFVGSPFNNVFIPRGGAFVYFLADSSTPLGVYTFYVHLPGQPFGSRTAFNVTG